MKTVTTNVANRIIVAYIPVLHQGYKVFFDANPSYRSLLILDNEVTDTDRSLQKDIRRLDPQLVRRSLSMWNIMNDITIANEETLQVLNSNDNDILMPDEDISHELASKYFPDASVRYYPIFLRWDRQKSNANDPIDVNAEVTREVLHEQLMGEARTESMKSSDIWRRVGAIISKQGVELARSHNQSRPTQHSAWIYGDPRNNFKKGTDIDKSVFIHAEAQLIGHAARDGVSLKDCDMYVTTFPCPPCAMLIAESGISRLFFSEGYAVLDGQRVLQSRGVELVRVVETPMTELVRTDPSLPYPEK